MRARYGQKRVDTLVVKRDARDGLNIEVQEWLMREDLFTALRNNVIINVLNVGGNITH